MIKVPPMTTERRTEMTKVVSRDGEDAKIAIRNKRHDARKHAEVQFKADEISENTRHSIENKVDEHSKKINLKSLPPEIIPGRQALLLLVASSCTSVAVASCCTACVPCICASR